MCRIFFSRHVSPPRELASLPQDTNGGKQIFLHSAFLKNHHHSKKGRRLAQSCWCYLQLILFLEGLAQPAVVGCEGSSHHRKGLPAEERSGSG